MDRGHAAVEFALAVAVLMLPVALVVTAFGPWSEKRVFAESAAAETARAAVIALDIGLGEEVLAGAATAFGLEQAEVRLGWCGALPSPLPGGRGSCSMDRGSAVSVQLEVWTPLVSTPWGPVGGIWVRAGHVEPVDLYRSLP
jgi:hypothetical protein